LLNHSEAVSVKVSVLIDIGNGSHEGTENNLGVVLEEVDLQQNKTNFKIN
jgi:hypothetical protein